jgi:hypothetical protein
MTILMTTLFNQSVDSVTRANAVWAQTSDPRWLTTAIDPSHPLYTPNMDSFRPLNLGTSVQPDIALITMANTFSERLIGISDPAFGRETRSGGHPSPATSTLAMLEQTQQMATATLSLLRDGMSNMGMAWAVLTQQFETDEDGRLTRTFGESDAKDIRDLLIYPTEPIPLNYLFNIAAMSETQNPDTEMRRAVVVDQMSTAFWSFVLQGIQVLESPQAGPAMKQGWMRAIESKKSSYERFLEAAAIDDIERFTGELRGAVNSGAQDQLNAATGAGRELAAGAGVVSPAGLAGGPAPGFGGGANGMAPQGRLLQ